MKTTIFTAALVVLSASACAQMPLPVLDSKLPALTPVLALPSKVDKLMIVPAGGDLIGLIPRKGATDPCPATFATFQIWTAQVGGMQSAVVQAHGVAWEWASTKTGQPICTALLHGETIPFVPKPGARFSASVRTKHPAGAESEQIALRSVCKNDVCQFLSPEQVQSTAASPTATDKIAAQATALQTRVGKLWDATGGKLIGSDCNTDYQCQNNDNGTIGETIKPRK